MTKAAPSPEENLQKYRREVFLDIVEIILEGEIDDYCTTHLSKLRTARENLKSNLLEMDKAFEAARGNLGGVVGKVFEETIKGLEEKQKEIQGYLDDLAKSSREFLIKESAPNAQDAVITEDQLYSLFHLIEDSRNSGPNSWDKLSVEQKKILVLDKIIPSQESNEEEVKQREAAEKKSRRKKMIEDLHARSDTSSIINNLESLVKIPLEDALALGDLTKEELQQKKQELGKGFKQGPVLNVLELALEALWKGKNLNGLTVEPVNYLPHCGVVISSRNSPITNY